MSGKKWLLALVILILAACGGKKEAGVTLKAPQKRPAPTPTATTPSTAAAQANSGLTGRLLYLKGRQFQLLNLETGETTSFEDVLSNTSAAMSADNTRGAFVAFPNFGVIDLTTGTETTIQNTGSNPNGFDMSPDGRWVILDTGGFYRTQLQIAAADGSTKPQNVAAESGAFYQWAWTTNSRLVWWKISAPSEVSIFDPATSQSTPVGQEPLQLARYPFADISPDGTRMAAIIPFDLLDPSTLIFNTLASDSDGIDATPTPAETCSDSVIELYPLPITLGSTPPAPQAVWTAPGLVASSPEWLNDHTLLFVKVGTGTCGQIEGDPVREIMIMDLDGGTDPRPVAGPIGNMNDRNDEEQFGGLQFSHLYDASPDGQYVAWVGGSFETDETMINVTNIETGETQTIVHLTKADAPGGTADFLENFVIRGVIWLP